VIVVEGPDGAGKTTLLERLSKDLGFPVAPRVVSKDTEAMVDLQKWTEDNVSKGFQRVLYDRHRLFSEPIYGSVLREDFEPGFDNFVWLQEMFSKFWECRPYVIYCLPPFDVVKKNVENDPDNSVPGPHIRSIYSLYVSRAAADFALNSRVMIYNFFDDLNKDFSYGLLLTRLRNA
jgi:hypothetical protein